MPYLCDYRGIALFLDADMLVTSDVAELFDLKDDTAVQVVKNKQRFEWPSLMLFDNAQCRHLTPEYIDSPQSSPQSLKWAPSVGDLPPEWNFCVGYDNHPSMTPSLIHYTKGIPIWPETKSCDYAGLWWEQFRMANSTVSYAELMGGSIHAAKG